MANFLPKPRTNPFEKMTIFRFFELLVFIPQKNVFSLQNIVKHIFLPYITFQKKMEKWPIFDQNHGLTSFEKWQFFHFSNFLFLQPEKGFFFVLEYRKTHFPGLYYLKKKNMEKWPIFDQNHGPLEKWQFFHFLKFLFYSLKRHFFVLEFLKTHFPLLYCLRKKFGNMANF